MSALTVGADQKPPKAALVRVDDVQFHPRNVRRDLGDLRELTNSIARYGIMQPIIVEVHGTRVRLRAGHRRLAAARLAGLTRIPALIHSEALDEAEWVIQALHENVMRRSLDPPERADAIKRLRTLGRTWQDIADSLGISTVTAQKWAQGTTTLVVVDTRTGEEEPAPRLGRTASRQKPVSKTVARNSLRRVLDAWRAVPQPTSGQVLDALQVIVEGGAPAAAMPVAEASRAE